MDVSRTTSRRLRQLGQLIKRFEDTDEKVIKVTISLISFHRPICPSSSLGQHVTVHTHLHIPPRDLRHMTARSAKSTVPRNGPARPSVRVQLSLVSW